MTKTFFVLFFSAFYLQDFTKCVVIILKVLELVCVCVCMRVGYIYFYFICQALYEAAVL